MHPPPPSSAAALRLSRPPRRAARAALLAGAAATALFFPTQLFSSSAAAAPQAPSTAEWFVDAAAASGLDFVHFNGMSGELYFAEMMGGGGALFDFDGDGDLDVFLVQGSMLGGKPLAEATFPPRGPLRHRLYRNDLAVAPDGRRTLRFTDVTEGSGIETAGYGNGAAAGDFDNDGRVDLYVLAVGGNQLLRNLGGGRFADVTRAAGVEERRWSAAASFFDFDRDGWLDLYVGNYVDWSAAQPKFCPDMTGANDYCGPLAFTPQSDRLFRNRGRGPSGEVSFEEVTARALPHAAPGTTLGSVAADFDGDGWQDLYVANDAEPNQLWMNQRDGTFRDEALLAGCAVNERGLPEASMGVDAGDVDGDGDEDLFMTHLNQETNTLYVNDGNGFFADRSRESGLGPPSWLFTGFGTALFDYDNDGRLDAAAVNGAVKLADAPRRSGDPYPLHQTNQLFRNLGSDQRPPGRASLQVAEPITGLRNLGPGPSGLARFEEVTARAGAVWQLSEVSRGAAFGDVDDDGDIDILVVNNAGPVRLLLNQVGSARPWLGLRLVDAGGRRDQLGARVEVRRRDGPALWRRSRSDGSYLVANDPRVLIGLGDASEVTAVRVHWPSGRSEEWTGLPLRAYTTLREGTGKTVTAEKGRAGAPAAAAPAVEIAPTPVAGAQELSPERVGQGAEVSFERMHPTVAQQLREAAELVAALAGRGGTPPAEMARAYGGLGQLYLVYEIYEPAAEALGKARAMAPEEPRWSYLDGVALQELRRMDEAAAALEAALAVRPGDAMAQLRLGQIELERGRAGRARQLFERALAEESLRAAARFGLGRLAAAERRWSDAVRHFEAALAAQPQATTIRHPLALAYRELGQLDRARELLLHAAGDVPVTFADPWLDEAKRAATGPGIHALRALGAKRRGDGKRAVEELRRAVALDPGNDQLRQRLAVELEEQGEVAAALAEYREAVRLAADSPLAHLNLGAALARQREDGPALEHLRRAVALAPDFQTAQRYLGTLLLQTGRTDEALTHFTRARDLDPTDRGARLGRAAALRRLARYAEAEEEVRSVLARDAQDAAALVELGAVLASRGDGDGALAAWEQAAKLPAADPAAAAMANLQSAQLLAARGAAEAALERLRAAVTLRPDLAVAHFNLATLLAERGDYAAAASGYAKVVELKPADREAHLALAHALAAAGRRDEARAALEEGLRKLPGDSLLTQALKQLASDEVRP